VDAGGGDVWAIAPIGVRMTKANASDRIACKIIDASRPFSNAPRSRLDAFVIVAAKLER
jgi:hypothetical protein